MLYLPMEGRSMPIGRPLASSLIISSATALENEYVFGQLLITLEHSYKCEFINFLTLVLNRKLLKIYSIYNYSNLFQKTECMHCEITEP
jgi:hypothetical protein